VQSRISPEVGESPFPYGATFIILPEYKNSELSAHRSSPSAISTARERDQHVDGAGLPLHASSRPFAAAFAPLAAGDHGNLAGEAGVCRNALGRNHTTDS
jgi:hypothetical protein